MGCVQRSVHTSTTSAPSGSKLPSSRTSAVAFSRGLNPLRPLTNHIEKLAIHNHQWEQEEEVAIGLATEPEVVVIHAKNKIKLMKIC
jgi:hypothetical protein